jgi:hypothetical protein
VFTIVASSPQEKHYKALLKLRAARRYMPCWVLEELKAVGIMSDHLIEKHFLQWGGIPRYIFDKDQNALLAILATAINGMNMPLVEKYLKSCEISESDQKTISHMVVQYRPIGDKYEECELDFASDKICDSVIQVKGKSDYAQLIDHYQRMRRTEWQGAYVGHLWEHLCHEILPLGTSGGFRLEPLNGNNAKNSMVLKSGIKVVTGGETDMKKVVKRGCYFKPPVIDACFKEGDRVFGLHKTIAARHPPKAKEAAKLLEQFPNLNLFWVVDNDPSCITKAQQFEQGTATTLQKLERVPQWLLQLQFPKDNFFKSLTK